MFWKGCPLAKPEPKVRLTVGLFVQDELQLSAIDHERVAPPPVHVTSWPPANACAVTTAAATATAMACRQRDPAFMNNLPSADRERFSAHLIAAMAEPNPPRKKLSTHHRKT